MRAIIKGAFIWALVTVCASVLLACTSEGSPSPTCTSSSIGLTVFYSDCRQGDSTQVTVTDEYGIRWTVTLRLQ